MLNPLILTLEEFTARQAEFALYDKSLSMGCVETMEPKAFTARIRKIIIDELGKVARDGTSQGADSLPQSPIWGPTVRSSDVATIYFKLVPQGTDNEYPSTDGTRRDVQPPALPGIQAAPLLAEALTKVPGNHLAPMAFTPEHRPKIQEYLDEAKRQIASESPQKLYRVIDPVEVTADEISAEMSKRARKNAKPAIYIRGTIVEPKMRVEI